MAKACDYCPMTNGYVCHPSDHCGLCPKGQTDETITSTAETNRSAQEVTL
jgi:hypothetical protein